MTQAARKRGGDGRGRGVAIGFSLVAHMVALALLAWTTPALRLPTTAFAPDVTVELVRSIPLERRPPAPVAAPRAAAGSPPAAATQTARRAAAPPPPSPPLPAPSRPTPRPAATAPPSPTPAPSPAPPGPQARPGPPSPAPAAAGPVGDVRGAVRAAIGCSHEDFLKLTPAERAACERKMAQTPPTGAYVDPIPPLKRGAYDRRAQYDERCHRYATPVIKPGPGRGLNDKPVFDSAPSAAQPSGPPPPSPWLFC